MAEQDYKFYLNEGIELTNQGKFEDAIDSLNKSLELNKGNALTYFSKAIAYHNLGQLRAAYENYGKAILLELVFSKLLNMVILVEGLKPCSKIRLHFHTSLVFS